MTIVRERKGESAVHDRSTAQQGRFAPPAVKHAGSEKGTIRLGLNQVKSLNLETAERIVAERNRKAFANLTDFLVRVEPSKDERRVLAKIGALNGLEDTEHRRDALWKVEQFVDPEDLFTMAKHRQAQASRYPISSERELPKVAEGDGGRGAAPAQASGTRDRNGADTGKTSADTAPRPPLKPMDQLERLQADYDGTGLTTGPHPMRYVRDRLPPEIWRASDLVRGKPDDIITIAGLVICRQRPSTAKGHVFISLEDETGISNAFVPGPTFDQFRLIITQEPFLKITGRLQIQHEVTSLYTLQVEALPFAAEVRRQSHDFH